MAFYAIAVCLLSSGGLWTVSESKSAEIEAIHSTSRPLNIFAVQLLDKTSQFAGQSKNLALSPYTIWSLLTIISEGARGNTASQLEKALNIPPVNQRQDFRRNYKSLTKYLKQNTEGVDMEITNAIFTTSEYPLNDTFQQTVQTYYGVDLIPVDFKNSAQAVDVINSYIRKATANRIPYFADSSDVTDAKIFITSALYFKGRWTVPFNKTDTFLDAFYDEKRNKVGDVMMMFGEAPYPYAAVPQLKARVVQLFYGKEQKMSMFIVLPNVGEMLSTVLTRIASLPMSELIRILQEAREQFLDENVQVYLPKFKIENDFNLNVVLDEGLGISDIFNIQRADLLGMFPQYSVVSRVIQKAEIEVDEEGTVASAVAGASIIDKIVPPRFVANRPFAYIIVDHRTESIVFIGKVYNPTKVR